MGYRSMVASAIIFTNTEERDAFLAENSSLVQKIGELSPSIPKKGRHISIQHNHVKWYETMSIGGLSLGFESVDAWNSLLAAAEEDDDAGIRRSAGRFVRVGEEYDDIEVSGWDSGDLTADLPEQWEIADVSVSCELHGEWS